MLRQRGFTGLIVGVTGHVFEDDVAAFLEAGADLVLAKPLKVAKLQMLLTFIAENRENRSSSEIGTSAVHVTNNSRKHLVEQNHRLCWKA